jgi:hypothetical protein
MLIRNKKNHDAPTLRRRPVIDQVIGRRRLNRLRGQRMGRIAAIKRRINTR